MSILLNFYIIFPIVLLGKSEVIDEKMYMVNLNMSVWHRDRTPSYFYQNDPYKNASYWPEGLGELTNEGKQQEYELGLWLRGRYDALLTERYSPDVLYVQSTDVDRTLMSAQCVLAGMYPPKETQVWNEHLAWQPIPVHTVPAKLDNFFTGFAHCLAFDEEEKNVLNSKEIQELNERYAEVYKVLNENTGENKHYLTYIFDVYSTRYVEIYYRNSTLEEHHLLTIPGCSPACPLEQFITITQPLAINPEEWYKECGR